MGEGLKASSRACLGEAELSLALKVVGPVSPWNVSFVADVVVPRCTLSMKTPLAS